MNNVDCIELLIHLETGKCIALQESLARQFLESSQQFLEFAQAQAFVCGPTVLVETVASALVELGYAPQRVKTERFGPSGVTP